MSKRKATPPAGESPADRRDHHRFCIQGAQVQYMKVQILSFVDKELQQRDDLLNVSEGGMLFYSKTGFPIGQCLSLMLHLPAFDDTPCMRGTVVRSDPPEHGDRHQVGVRITMCSSDGADLLRSLPKIAEDTPTLVELYVRADQ